MERDGETGNGAAGMPVAPQMIGAFALGVQRVLGG